MLKNALRVIDTMMRKIRHGPRLTVDGWLNFRWDTKLNILEHGHVTLGRGVHCYERVVMTCAGGRLTIGEGCSLNRNDIIVCRDSVTIGRYCGIGPNVLIYDHDHAVSGEGFRSEEYRCAPIVIEERCWIGANVVILRGSHIGKGCVIGAGTVVKGDIPAHSLAYNRRELVIRPIPKEG